MSLYGRLTAIFPLFETLHRDNQHALSHDLLAGTITAILLVPQTLAYSLLAGLPPQMGLYAGIVPPLIYALTASSRVSVVGPVAVQAVMIAGVTAAHAANHSAAAVALAIGGMSGVLLLGLGVLRLGWVTNFISHPVLSGFSTGAALFIICSQLGSLMGIKLPQSEVPIGTLINLLTSLQQISLPTSLFGWTAVVLLILARGPLAALFRSVDLPESRATLIGRAAPIVAVAIGALVSQGIDASTVFGVRVVGEIPRGLPHFSADIIDLALWKELAPSALLIAIVGYVETISVARVLGFRRRQNVDADRELVALGLANLGSTGFGGMPVAGGFTKSSANFEAGATSQLSSVVAASWVALSAALLTGLLEDLPRAILSAIIIVAVWKLVDFRSLRHNLSFSLGDGAAQIGTIAGVLLLGVEQGLVVGVCVAAALFLYRTSRPNVVVVGRIPGTPLYRNASRRDVETFDHLLLIRIDESLYFANSSRVESELQRLVIAHPKATEVVLILSAVGHIDASSLQMLENFERVLSSSGIRLMLAEAKGPLMEQLRHTALLKRIGADRVFVSTHDAVASMSADLW